MSESLDLLLDHAAALHGVRVTWKQTVDGKWCVTLHDRDCGCPCGWGTTLEAAAKGCLYNMREFERLRTEAAVNAK